MKPSLWALLVALLCFLATVGLFCFSASAGGAHWGDTSYGILFFIGCCIGCCVSNSVFERVATLLTKHVKEVH